MRGCRLLGRRILAVLSFLLAIVAQLQLYSLAGGCDSYEIKPGRWDYKSRYEIGYEVAKAKPLSICENEDDNKKKTNKNKNKNNRHPKASEEQPILLLNGFGVGSFHQHRLIHELLNNAADGDDDDASHRTIYCMDYLGQGRSWPKDCRDGLGVNEKDLQYSADTWCNQIIDFLETIVLPSYQDNNETAAAAAATTTTTAAATTSAAPTKVHLVGNSVGGHLAAHVAVRRPDLVASLCLLNPTPVWGSKLPGWDGHLPAPVIPKAVGRYLFDRIRDLPTIDAFLTATYSRRRAFGDELMHQIRGCTLGNGGHAAFASIMWSPPIVSKPHASRAATDNGRENQGKGDFYDCLKNASCDVLLVFGKDDPWCKPSFARNMLLALEERNKSTSTSSGNTNNSKGTAALNHRYMEITNAGHCPNHEAPRAVGHLVNQWVSTNNRSQEKDGSATSTSTSTTTTFITPPLSFAEEWGEMTVRERNRNDIEVGWVDKIVTAIL